MSNRSATSRRRRSGARKKTPQLRGQAAQHVPTNRLGQQRSAENVAPLLPPTIEATIADQHASDLLAHASQVSAPVPEQARFSVPPTSGKDKSPIKPLPPLPDVALLPASMPMPEQPRVAMRSQPDRLPESDAARGWVVLPLETRGNPFSQLIERLPGQSTFRLSERDWRSYAWVRRVRALPGIAILLLVLLFASASAFVLATRASHATNKVPISFSHTTSANNNSNVIVQQPPAAGAPTPAAAPYLIGVWTSNSSPGASGSVQVFVRVSHNNEPVPGVRVSLNVSANAATSPPVKTDADGVAIFTLHFGGAGPGNPVFITATAAVKGQNLTAETTLIP